MITNHELPVNPEKQFRVSTHFKVIKRKIDRICFAFFQGHKNYFFI